jgi:hypothetical protein
MNGDPILAPERGQDAPTFLECIRRGSEDAAASLKYAEYGILERSRLGVGTDPSSQLLAVSDDTEAELTSIY